jgi:hypothetical protein
MPPTGVIAGRITERNGEPAVRASVQAYQSIYRDGKRTFAPVQSTTTNDLGEYRLFRLPAGRYFVAATLGKADVYGSASNYITRDTVLIQENFLTPSVVRRLLDDGSIQEEAWVPIYYPSTTEPENATSLEVTTGATMNGVNIAVAPTPVRRVRGQVVVPPGTNVRVHILTLGPLDGLGSKSVTGPSFEFTGMKPGSYVLFAEDGRNYASAPMPIEVGDRDVENLRIGVRPKLTLTGRVTLENSASENAGPGDARPVIVLHQGSASLPMSTARPDPNTGAFVINNVSPGEYQFRVQLFEEQSLGATEYTLGPTGFRPLVPPGTPEELFSQVSDASPFYVKSAKLGQRDVTNGLTITEGTQDRLEIVLTRGSGSVEGFVAEPGRNAAAGSTVVLIPAVARKNVSLYKSTVSDGSGRFRFQGIPAGDYLVFAWNDIETGAWQDPEFMRPFESRGFKVQVSGNSNQDIQLSLISTR